jgi:hypothetical protein
MTRTRRLTLLYSAARAGFGLALLVPPSWAAERWIGRDAGRRPVAVAMAGLAARDLALALGAIDALRRDGAVAPWLVAASAVRLGRHRDHPGRRRLAPRARALGHSCPIFDATLSLERRPPGELPACAGAIRLRRYGCWDSSTATRRCSRWGLAVPPAPERRVNTKGFGAAPPGTGERERSIPGGQKRWPSSRSLTKSWPR